jgi:hypothetical protein
MWRLSGNSCGPQPPGNLGVCPGSFNFTFTRPDMLRTTLFLPTAAITARVTCEDFSRIQQTLVSSTADGASTVLDGSYEVAFSKFARKTR